MQEFYEKNKQLVIGGVIVLVLLIAGGIFAVMRPTTQTADETTEVGEEMEAPIPTVGPEVKVNLEGINNNQDVVVTVEGVPEGTEEIEVEISYEREEASVDGPIADGSFAVMEPEGNKAETEIKLGTCSSGVCRYHNLTSGEIRTVLKFNGDYGDFDEQLFEGTFQLEGFENADADADAESDTDTAEDESGEAME